MSIGTTTEKPLSLIVTPASFISKDKDAQLGQPTPRFDKKIIYIKRKRAPPRGNCLLSEYIVITRIMKLVLCAKN